MNNLLNRSGKNSPCPVCERTKDADCRWREDFVLCHTFVDSDAGAPSFKYRGATKDGLWGQYARQPALTVDNQKPIRRRGKKEFFYPSRDGSRLVKVQRIDHGRGSKKFIQFHWNGENWCPKLPDYVKKQVPIYCYQEVQKAISMDKHIFLVEGEECANKLWKLGIAATTTIGGSAGYKRYGDYAKDLENAYLVLCPDQDQPGIKYMETIAKDFPHAQWFYPYPNSDLWNTALPSKGGLDIADWIDQEGTTREEILAAVGLRNHQYLVSEKDETCTTETNMYLSYEDVIKRVGEILQIDEGRQDWEGGLLASRIKGFSWNQLKSMYQKSLDCCTEFKPVDVHEFLESGPENRAWLISGYISRATTLVLFADGGVGKTLLAYDMSRAIALGQSWNGFRVNQGKVLIIQTDEPEIDTRERLNIAGFKDIPAGQIHIESHWQFSQLDKLKRWIEAERPAFVMIDSLTSANRSAIAGSEWDASYAASLYNLRDIANTYGCSIMILHHENKGGGARGTTAIRNNVSEVWRLRRGTEKETLKPTQRILEIEKSRSSCNGTFQIELDLDNFSWVHQGDFGEQGRSLPLFAQILNYLETRPGIKFEPEELLSEFPCSSKDAIRKQLERLRSQGLIESEERTKTHKTGASRYKVYFIKQQGNKEDKHSIENLSSVDETKIHHSVQTLDSLNSCIDDVQGLESL
ncbi:MAG TPA: AAA family ATPase [Leptolyngbyaceae cyanobacterium M33_DOE_097]|nr:AAA family ATPase [Leptolyngbyaceae cyanobacterium M33_DOE_097]